MSWIANNWIWIILIAGMIAMHLGHGGHSGHGGTARHSDQSNRPEGGHAEHTALPQPPAFGDKDASAPATRHGY